jgi:hypothetical protein
VLARYLGRPVVRSVDTDHVRPAVGHVVDVVEDGADGRFLVVRAHHDGHVVVRVAVRDRPGGVGRVARLGRARVVESGPAGTVPSTAHAL